MTEIDLHTLLVVSSIWAFGIAIALVVTVHTVLKP